jgi:HSP20 family molecular chaperone IbpA
MGYYPRTDMSIDSEGLLIEISVPGLNATDVKLELVNNNLTISGTNKQRNQYARYIEKELCAGFFSRSYNINTNLFDISSIVSQGTNGLLTIRIPHKNKSINNVQVVEIKEV